jgi:chorismate mutase
VKKRLATEVDAPSREDEVMSNIAQHNRGPLNDEALRRIYERIIGEMKLLQRGRTTENGNF